MSLSPLEALMVTLRHRKGKMGKTTHYACRFGALIPVSPGEHVDIICYAYNDLCFSPSSVFAEDWQKWMGTVLPDVLQTLCRHFKYIHQSFLLPLHQSESTIASPGEAWLKDVGRPLPADVQEFFRDMQRWGNTFPLGHCIPDMMDDWKRVSPRSVWAAWKFPLIRGAFCNLGLSRTCPGRVFFFFTVQFFGRPMHGM